MFGDIGWAELLLIGIVALIVIGPEDLPQMFRQIGRFTAKLRAMSRDFSRAMEQAAKESGAKDVTDTLKGATSATSMGLNKVKAAADRFEKWDPMKGVSAGPPKAAVVTPPVSPTSAPVQNEVAPTAEPAHKIHGPETQALLQKHAAKKAVLAQTAEKLKAISAGTDESLPEKSAPMPRKTRAKPVEAGDVPAKIKQPRGTRVSKQVDVP